MNNLQKEIIRYQEWRKGVLMLMPFELVLIVVVFGLMIVTFFISLTSTKGAVALAALKTHLNSLQLRFGQSSTMDAEVERTGVERAFNEVKATCSQNIISSDVVLKSKMNLAYEQISTITNGRDDETKSSWIKLKAATYGFGEFYFPGFPN